MTKHQNIIDDLNRFRPANETLYRLGCINCDRSDCDFCEHLPADWSDIVEADPSDSPSAWQTHLGLCPLCQADE
jgi:hypothetical protein